MNSTILVLLAVALGVPSASAPMASEAAKLVGADRINTHTLETVWNGKRTVFVDYPTVGDEAGDNFLQMYAVQASDGPLVPIKVAEVGPEGGDPELAAIGFANADRDPAKELIVILEWSQKHYDYGGSFLEVWLFDDPKPGQPALAKLTRLSEHFGLGCECSFRDGSKAKHYRFGTIANVKRELRKLGY
jgi:hypothetical protein